MYFIQKTFSNNCPLLAYVGGHNCLPYHPHWPAVHMLREDNSNKGLDRLSRNLVSLVRGRYCCCRKLQCVWFIPSQSHPPTCFVGGSSAAVCLLPEQNKRRLQTFHQSSYFLGITQGKVICNFTTLFLGNVPPLLILPTSRKNSVGSFCNREKYATTFPQ